MESGVLVPALLFTTGTHTDAGGNTQAFEKKDLNRIVRATKKYYGEGDDIPLFEAEHEYSNEAKIGRLMVDEGLTVQEITEDNLPDPRLSSLIGEYGIYGYGLITRTDAIERYNQTLIKPVSIAFDPSGDFTNGHKWAIFEVSAVSWGAVRGAMLFGRFLADEFSELSESDEESPGTSSQPHEPQVFALTLDGAIAEHKGKWDNWDEDEEIAQLMMTFNDVISSIRHTTDEELQGRDRNTLMREAISDLRDKLQEMLGVRRDPPPTVSVNSKPLKSKPLKGVAMTAENNTVDVKPTPETDDQMTVLMSRVEALEKANADLTERADKADKRADIAEQTAQQLAFERQVSDRVIRLKTWAQKLRGLGKLTPAAYKEWFPEDEQPSDAVLRFSKPATDDQPSGESDLDDIEAALKYTDKYAQPVKFGSSIGEEPLNASPYQVTDPADAEAAAEYAKDFRARNPVKRQY